MMFTAALLIALAKKWKQPKCSSADEWMKKMWYCHKMEWYLALKRNGVPIRATIR